MQARHEPRDHAPRPKDPIREWGKQAASAGPTHPARHMMPKNRSTSRACSHVSNKLLHAWAGTTQSQTDRDEYARKAHAGYLAQAKTLVPGDARIVSQQSNGQQQ